MPRRKRGGLSYKDTNASKRIRRNEIEDTDQTREVVRQRMARIRAERNQAQVAGQSLDKRLASTANYNDEAPQHNCGELNVRCKNCQAKHFKDEMPSDKLFNCCSKGKVKLPEIETDPLIQSLMQGNHEHSKNFFENIRSINSALAFASMGAKLASPPGYGPYCFRINGQIYHRAGALHPENGDQQKFAQLYILDPEAAAKQRMSMVENAGCNPQLMHELSAFFATNPFAEACKMMYEVEQECIQEAQKNGIEPPTVTMAIVQDRKNDQRRYNAPASNEVAIVFQNSDGEPPLERDLLIHCRSEDGRKTKKISILDPNLEPMVYPLLFPHGDQSWTPDLKLQPLPYNLALNIRRQNPNSQPRVRVSQKQYYDYIFAIRDRWSPFLNAGKLTQQYLVDAYVKTEANRLNFARLNQSKLRVEKYTGLMDHVNSAAAAQGLIAGKPIILPSSFGGSPRNMNQNYQDAMAIVRKFGKPDLFITMTCNPKWPEIVENLEPGQSAENRPDLVARVFKLKLDALFEDIMKHKVFGKVVAKIHVIEFQKRGLPHAHILLILAAEDKPKDSDSIDKLICAEIPDIDENPRLHEIVTKHMIHGPCGEHNLNSPCMVDGECSKNFPKNFQEETLMNVDGYPRYQRRKNGVTAIVRNKTIDNSWIVPYNPFLSLKYNCHINVESCASVKSVKYLFKYVYKGHDCANVAIGEQGVLNHDEIKSFMDSRYVSAPEAAWRLFGFPMHEQSHTIYRLQVHLPGEQSVYFTEDNMEERIERAAEADTTLTGWFKLNQEDESAREILYADIPNHYVWNKTNRKWTKRQKGGNSVIGRMYTVSPVSDVERFCLRLLLLHTPGAQSFNDLKTVDGTCYQTFKEAAQKRHLLNDDQVWDMTLQEAANEKMPRPLRELFAHLCVLASPPNVPQLFEKYKDQLCEDFSRHDGHNDECVNCMNFALRDIEEILRANGKQCADFGLPSPPRNLPHELGEFFDTLRETEKGAEMQATLNECQKKAFDAVIASANNPNLPHRCHFLDGPGGSGKTYLYKTLLSTLRGEGEVVLAVASTGIAANLLEGGRTYHSQFKFPVPLLDTSTSSMRANSHDAELLRKAKIIIWDESTMAPSDALRCLDLLLREIMKNNKPFGGKTILLGGDFRQTLPVVVHGSRQAIVQSSIKFNKYWKHFKIHKLENNVRSVDPEFSDWLLELGDGKLTNTHGFQEDIFEIPQHMVCKDSIVTEIFGEKLTVKDAKDFAKMAILCPKNSDVDEINEQVLNLLEGVPTTYRSADSIDDCTDEDQTNYPTEFLNGLTPSGMPVHELNLKVGAIIMLLRNLTTKRGLCNGTRAVVKRLLPNLIIAEVLTGSAEGKTVFIPRIDLAPTNTDLPFVLRRRQFPIKLAFAMTINKSQGQTLDKVGIYLPEPVFSHGQLYVAFSRAKSSANVRVKVLDGREQGCLIPGSEACFTKNVVFKEIYSM